MDEDAARELIAAARATVSERIAALTADVAGLVAASRDANADDEHDPEGSTIAFERAQVLALLDRARAELAELDAADERLAAGTFGRCVHCGGAIGDERLAARPAASTCVACAARR
ncbi:MAG TPA: TraR/DksA C4-type zinc finger protein [Jatrophihabitantaceae bacterium]|nr:TraR/DksA C4-type zinc finger protein [Jatrophihabitantaceae bacterium]